MRLLVIHSPKSTNSAVYKKKVLPVLRELEYELCEFPLIDMPYFEACEYVKQNILPGDIVLAAGGDGVTNVALDAAMQSGKDVSLAVLPLGNFNDFSHSLNGNIASPADILKSQTIDFHPLDLIVNDQHRLYAGQYITFGISAKLTDFLNSSAARKLRRKLRGSKMLFGAICALNYKRIIGRLGRNTLAVPEFTRHAKANTSNDVGFMIGPIGGYFQPKAGSFHLKADTFWYHYATLSGKAIRDIPYLASWFGKHLPGEVSTGEKLIFNNATTLHIQVGGDKLTLKDVKKIECRRAKHSIKVFAPRLSKK